MTDAIRPSSQTDFDAILRIINAAARAYAGVIPSDRYHVPYMTPQGLRTEIGAGVRFWGWFDDVPAATAGRADETDDGRLIGVMGVQDVADVTLIRHAYVLPAEQRRGIGGRLLAHLGGRAAKPLLVGTWASADWAIRFYERHGFELVTHQQKDDLLRRYWSIPKRQVETSVVLRRPGSGVSSP